jgi:DNA polymerase-1
MLAATSNGHFELAGRTFNLDSPKQLGALLFDELGLPVVKTPTGAPSTNEEALEAIADQHELPRLILEYRGLAKLRSTYTDKLPEMVNPDTGRVHTSYHQAGAATGRLSSSDPNLQNIPIRTEDGRRIRTAFVGAGRSPLVACDYSQIELRIMAHLSEDPGLVRRSRAVRTSTRHRGGSVRPATGSGRCQPAPRGQGDQLRPDVRHECVRSGAQLGIARGEAQDYIALYFSRYPGVQRLHGIAPPAGARTGYVETVFGRRLYLLEIASRNQAQRAGAERAAINAPMQGTAADIIKRAMRRVHDWLQPHTGDDHAGATN